MKNSRYILNKYYFFHWIQMRHDKVLKIQIFMFCSLCNSNQGFCVYVYFIGVHTLKEAKNSMFLRDFSGTWGEAWTNKSSSKSPHKSSLGSGLGLGLFMVVDPDGGARNWNLFIFAGLFSLLLFVQNIPDLFKILSKSI